MVEAVDTAALLREIEQIESALRVVGERGDTDGCRRRGILLSGLGENLMSLDRFDEAEKALREAATCLWQVPDQQAWAAHRMGRQAVALISLKRYDDALTVLSQLVARVGVGWVPPGVEGPLADVVPVALGPWLFLLERLHLPDQEFDAAGALIAAYDPPATPTQRLVVAAAFESRGRLSKGRGQPAEALRLFNEAIERCPADAGDEYSEILTSALAQRGALLEDAGRSREALSAYDEAVTRYRGSSDPRVRKLIADARAAQTRLASGRSWFGRSR